MQHKTRIIPAQRTPKGDLVFWMPYKRGCIHVEYNQALSEMNRKYGRTQTLAQEASENHDQKTLS